LVHRGSTAGEVSFQWKKKKYNAIVKIDDQGKKEKRIKYGIHLVIHCAGQDFPNSDICEKWRKRRTL
jgi:hypothetical protein